MSKITELQSKKTKLLSTAQERVNQGEANSPEYRALVAEIDLIQSDIDSLTFIESRMPAPTAPAAAIVGPTPVVTQSDRHISDLAKRRADINRGYASFLRHGLDIMRPEQRDLTTLSDAAGSALVPQEYLGDWIQALKWFSPVTALVTNIRQNPPRVTKIPVVDDTAAVGTFLPDTTEAFTSPNTTTTPSVDSLVTGSDALVTSLRYSVMWRDDTFDFTNFLQRVISPRVSRILELAILKGVDGHGTALTNSPTGGLVSAVQSSGIVQANLTTVPTYTQLAALAGSVDKAYRADPDAGFLVGENTYTALTQVLDSTGRPLYEHDSNSGRLMIAGKPVYVASEAAMPDYTTASSSSVLFGSFAHLYATIQSDIRIQILRERFSDVMEQAAVISVRLGAAALLANSVKAITTPAS